MMGPTHALMGLAAGLASAPWVCAGLAETAAWAALCAGTALLPDLDTPESSAARTWGRTTQLLANIVRLVSKGHRKWSHHVIAAPAAAGVVWLAGKTWGLSYVMCALLIGLALTSVTRIFGQRMSAPINFTVSLVAAYVVMSRDLVDFSWLALSAALGVVVHIAGDALTAGGVPGALPSSKRVRLSTIRTGGVVERMVVTPVMVVLCLMLAAFHAHPVLG